MDIFEARNISKSFGDRTLLKDISFKIKTGEKIERAKKSGSLVGTVLGKQRSPKFCLANWKRIAVRRLRQ